jgi:allantoate deiminase
MSTSYAGILLATFCLLHVGVSSLSHVDSIIEGEAYKKCDDLGKLSDKKEYLVRTFLSPAHKRAAYLLAKWMSQAGMTTWIDDIRNVHGYIPGAEPNLPALFLGSHYDTAIDAGKYDGPLGIVTAIAAVKATLVDVLESQGRLHDVVNMTAPELHVPASVAKGLLQHPVHIVAFSDEEGIRFQSTFLGSRALAGTVLKYGMLTALDKAGISVEESMQMEGVDDVEEALQGIAIDPASIRGYVEVHIEQGPVLESINKPLAVVTAIAGQRRLLVTVNGEQGHAGTVPMSMRHDALTAAADLITMIESKCGGGPRFGFNRGAVANTDEGGLVCTVGEIAVHPAASNVIPGSSVFSVDIRTHSDTLLEHVQNNLTASVNTICTERGVRCGVEVRHVAATVHSDWELTSALKVAIRNAQVHEERQATAAVCSSVGDAVTSDADSEGNVCFKKGAAPPPASTRIATEVPSMVSGAGHDAMALAELTKVAMVFVRCRGGLSHTPLEHVEPKDVALATRTLYELLKMELL